MLLWLEFSLMYLITPCCDLSFWEARRLSECQRLLVKEGGEAMLG